MFIYLRTDYTSLKKNIPLIPICFAYFLGRSRIPRLKNMVVMCVWRPPLKSRVKVSRQSYVQRIRPKEKIKSWVVYAVHRLAFSIKFMIRKIKITAFFMNKAQSTGKCFSNDGKGDSRCSWITANYTEPQFFFTIFFLTVKNSSMLVKSASNLKSCSY